MKARGIRFNDSLWKDILREAKRHKVTASEYIRRILSRELEEEKRIRKYRRQRK